MAWNIAIASNWTNFHFVSRVSGVVFQLLFNFITWSVNVCTCPYLVSSFTHDQKCCLFGKRYFTLAFSITQTLSNWEDACISEYCTEHVQTKFSQVSTFVSTSLCRLNWIFCNSSVCFWNSYRLVQSQNIKLVILRFISISF